MKKSKDRFCVLPWTEAYVNSVGNYGLCCLERDRYNTAKVTVDQDFNLHWNSDYMKSVRRAFISGGDLPQCQVCWTDEDSGKSSMRQRRNHRYFNKADLSADDVEVRSIIDRTHQDGSIIDSPRAFHISVGDTCQLRCITCSPTYSRSILKDYQKLGWHQDFKNRREMESFQVLLDQTDMDRHLWPLLENFADNVEWLQITGGEPTMSKPLMKFLKLLIDRGLADRISIILNTNAVNIKQEFIDLMHCFRLCIFTVSVDGIGDLDEYIRYPTHWRKKEIITQQIMEEFPSSSVCMTMNSMNINMLDEMIQWGRGRGYKMSPILLSNPDELSFRHLPLEMKDHARTMMLDLRSQIQQAGVNDHDDFYDANGHLLWAIEGMLNYLDQPRDEAVWQQCLHIVKSYDSIRKKPLKAINPFFQY